MTNLSLTYSFWWIFICLIVGGGYGWIQYSKTAPWSTQLNYLLAGLRTLLIALICFFLLEPYLQSITNYFQKPLMVIAIDNSESMAMNASTDKLLEIKIGILEVEAKLVDQGFDVDIVDLTGVEIGNVDSLKFIKSTTDLSRQLSKVKNEYGNFNLSGIVLFTDGIFNEGFTPLALTTDYPIYTLGIGDTANIKDLSIIDIKHNSTVFEGNSLSLEIQVLNTGFKSGITEVTVNKKGKVVSKQLMELSASSLLTKAFMSIPITGSGKQSLTVNLKTLADEYTKLNNEQTVYFDVIDAQKKVLIIASAPHPDLKAIKSSIEKSEYYKVDLVYKLPPKLEYDLLIAHQYPSTKTASVEKNRFLDAPVPKWMVVGDVSDVRFLQNELAILKIQGGGRKSDLVKPILDKKFDAFQLSDDFFSWVSNVPPLSAPYGLVINKTGVRPFLNQQIGSVLTEEPLLFFTNQGDLRLGVLVGINCWKWRLDEYRVDQSHKNYDELISKTVQFLSANPSKKRFYARPQKEIYEKGEDVLINTEEYNALFERITGKKVALELTNEKGSKLNYSFVPLNPNAVYKISNLEEGVYSYNATTQIESKNYYATGQFVVQALNKEALNPVADFELLRKMAVKSQGLFYPLDHIGDFEKHIEEMSPVSVIHTTEKDEPLLNFEWVLGLLLLLVSTEWFLRKFYGGY